MLNIAVLISGGGTNLQALIDAQKNNILTSCRIRLVISDRSDADGLIRAEQNGIKTATVNKEASDFDTKLLKLLQASSIHIVVLAGFLSILGKKIIKEYDRRIINIHPSLIPSFCGPGYYGLKVHEAVINSGVKTTGATVHFVNEIPDGGDIIMQKKVKVHKGDTPLTLQKRVKEEAEWVMLPEAVEYLCRKWAKKGLNRCD
jgi:phosphoribosylglycinamide formyltransferase-1